jgi:sterol desaturase/sphingolipid hydroxylase (fatty acid hydroxylase superfamily)
MSATLAEPALALPAAPAVLEPSLARRAVRELAYPGTLLGSLVLAWALGAGQPGAWWAVSGTLVLVAAMILVLERVAPFSPRWRVGLRDQVVRTDALHTASTALTASLVEAVAWGALAALGARASAALGVALWPSSWPLALQVALGLVLGELGTYGIHRWCHASALGWRLHAMHHSATRLNLLASGRNHPFQAVLSYLAQTGPLVLLGAGGPALALCAVWKAVNGLLQHANVDTRSAWCGWVLASPDLHRWHHSLDLKEGNSNFGNNLIVWDLVFGTRHAPRGERPGDGVGVDGVRFPGTFTGQLLTPFHLGRWTAGKP